MTQKRASAIFRAAVLGTLFWAAGPGGIARAAQQTCTPDPGFNACVRFTNSGADQNFTVPAGVTSVQLKMWGAGGGGGESISGWGGGGSFVTGTLATTPGQALTVIVGSRGLKGTTTGGYGGGGAGGPDPASPDLVGASGGGRSAIRVDTVERITAAGAGGSAGGTANNASFAGGGDQDAAYATGSCVPGPAATRGTTTAGGAGGTGKPGYMGTAGTAFAGGAGGGATVTNTGGGGGGGGGYYGGGGGAGQAVGGTCTGTSLDYGQDGGGAGGASYVGGVGVTNGNITPGNRQTPGGTGDSQYVAGIAKGSYYSGTTYPSGHGLVVIQYRSPTVQVRKQMIGATGTFAFTGTNGYGSDSITVGTAGATVAGAVKALSAPAVETVLTETTPPANTVFTGATCTGLTGGATPVVNLTNRTVTLPAAGLTSDASVVCTFTNQASGKITLQKALGGAGRINAADQFTLSATGSGAPAAVNTTGSGTTVTSAAYSFTGIAGNSYVLDEAMAPGSASPLSRYTQSLSCTNTGGTTNVSGFTSLPLNVTLAAGDNISCTVTNAPKAPILTVQKVLGGAGRLSANDQFTLSASGLNAPGPVTTTGSGASVTSAPLSFTASAGSAYTLNEAMAAGSGSALSDYAQWVSCGNAGGPTNVSGITTLPINITPAAGDNISCTITNFSTVPGGGGTPGPVPVCNADPVIAGSSFTNPAWTRSGWSSGNTTTYAALVSDAGPGTMSQNVAGVTPGAVVTFGWHPGNAGSSTAGKSSQVTLSYAGTVYWTGTMDYAGNTTAASNGASCVSTCGFNTSTSAQEVQLRLPAGIPSSGALVLSARALTTPVNYIAVTNPVSIRNTGICLAKTSRGATGTFNFTTSGVDTTMGGGGTTASITTAAVNTQRYYDASSTRTNNQPLLITSPGATANVTIGETLPANFVLESVSCPGLSPVLSGNAITIANVPLDTVTTCTFTNATSSLTLNKALSGNRIAPGDQFTVAVRTGGASGPVVSPTATATTTGSASTVTTGSGTTGSFNATPGVALTLTEAGASGTNLANYTATLTCSDAAGVTPASALPSNEAFDPAAGRTITPAPGAILSCTITNSPTAANITGRVFLDNGQGGGTANDGILNGSETPLANVAVRLTNCAATPVVHATALTNGTGGYSFAVPTGIAAGAAMCVEETNPANHVSTGASVGGTALPSGSATSVAGTTYTYTRTGSPDRIAFTWSGSSHANLNFGDVGNATFAANGAKTGLPNSMVSYGHTFTAATAGQVRFSIASETATPNITGWNTQIFADTGCTGSLQPGAAQLYPPLGAPIAVATGAQVCVIVHQFIPANAPEGAINMAVVQAAFDYANANPSLSASYTLQDTTTVSSTALELKKEVRNVTQNGSFGISNQAKPGETLEYRITYTNNGDAPITSLTINDATPSYTTFVSATTGATPATLTSCMKRTPANPAPQPAVTCTTTQATGGTGGVEWKFVGPVNPGATGSVRFQVQVD